MATTKRTPSKAPKAEPGVVDIQLTPEQSAQIKRATKGQVDITTLRLRPDLNLRLQELTTVLGGAAARARFAQSVLNGAGGLWWA